MELRRNMKEETRRKLTGNIRRMARSKRGIFFTLIAISLLGLVLFGFTSTYSYSMQERSAIIETRVDTMNSFLHSVDTDMENAIYISGYRALVGLTDYVTLNGTYVPSTTAALQELFLNGTVDGHNSTIMLNNTFPYWVEKIKGKGQEIGINLTLDVGQVTAYQTDPWTVRFEVESTLNISDQKSTASWSQEKSLHSDISIIGFEDPLYALHTNGMILKRVNQTIYDGQFVVGNDTSNLKAHVRDTLYIAFNASPSFLNRFENVFNASEFGIESMVNKTEILNYCSISTSSVDHICWQQDSGISTYKVKGFNDTNFKIDNQTNGELGRVDRYGLQGVIY
ncbi:TPA: hypothetical protein HA265_06250 [Candidatus Woesearchaeota archaeon]|nr:hypothetical protein [Candidatus Woesearchaeota archaeon]